MAKQPAQFSVAQAVLDRLYEVGWMQGVSGGENGPNCVMGARWYAACVEGVSTVEFCDQLHKVALQHFPERMKNYPRSIAGFNDHPDTTFEDIVLVLEKVRAEGY